MEFRLINLTPHVLKFYDANRDIVEIPPEGSEIRAEQTERLGGECINGIATKTKCSYYFKSDEYRNKFPEGSVLVMSMLAAENLMKCGMETVLGSENYTIASPASGPGECTRKEGGDMISHFLVLYS